MASKFTVDTTRKLFSLNNGVTTLDARTEFYSAAKLDWKDDDALNKFMFPIDSIGGQDIGGGNAISPYYSLKYGWRVKPPETDTNLNITGNIITSEGVSPISGTDGHFDTVVQFTVSSNSLTTGGTPLTATDIWDLQDGIEPSLTPREAMRLFAAVLAGKVIITDNNLKFRDTNDSKDVLDVDADADGQRLEITYDVS